MWTCVSRCRLNPGAHELMFIERSEACRGGAPTETAELAVIMRLLAGLAALHDL